MLDICCMCPLLSVTREGRRKYEATGKMSNSFGSNLSLWVFEPTSEGQTRAKSGPPRRNLLKCSVNMRNALPRLNE